VNKVAQNIHTLKTIKTYVKKLHCAAVEHTIPTTWRR